MSEEISVLNFVTTVIARPNGTWPLESRVMKVHGLIRKAMGKIEDFLIELNGAGENVKFDQSMIYEQQLIQRQKMNVQIYVEFDQDNIRASSAATGLEIYLYIANKDIDSLPAGDNNEYTPAQFEKYELFMNTILHEMCHVFGAYHSDVGLMNGAVPLWPGFGLIDILDENSQLIVSETLHKYMNEDTFCDVTTYKQNSRRFIVFDCPSGIRGVFFLKNNSYTFKFLQLDYLSRTFTALPANDEWDAVYVVSSYGTSTYIRKEDIYVSKNYYRFRSY